MPFIVLRARVPRKLQLLDFFFSTNFVGPNRPTDCASTTLLESSYSYLCCLPIVARVRVCSKQFERCNAPYPSFLLKTLV